MYRAKHRIGAATLRMVILVAVTLPLAGGCQEADTLKRELYKKFNTILAKKKTPFVQREGITIRTCPLYRAANENSEVIRALPAETPIRLLDKIGVWFRVRTRDGREGYVRQKLVGGEEIIIKTQQLRKSIEGLPAQAEGITKSQANFRLEPGRAHEIIEVLPPGKKFEVYERVVTLRNAPAAQRPDGAYANDTLDDVKKDVWYKVKMEDGRVGYIYTHNMKLLPPADIANAVPWMRMVAWRSISVTEDPDRGAKNNYVVAYTPKGQDPGCDYTSLYLMYWSSKNKKMITDDHWRLQLKGILPITGYHFEGKPGFSIRYLHPTNSDKLVLASFVYSRGRVRKVSEEEIPNVKRIH